MHDRHPFPPRGLSTALVVMLLALPALGTDRSAFSHDDWAQVLERFVDDRGFVDYAGLAGDRAELDRYLASVAATGPETRPEQFETRQARLAYYVNAYNALVFAGVLERGPEDESVWKGGLISGYRFFVKRKWTLDGRRLSLKFLEDELIREGFEDPRIHAALNCASISCPRLPRRPFLAETLDQQLDEAMREFVTDDRHVRRTGDRVQLSKIFDWFREDFLPADGVRGDRGLLTYVNRYRSPEDQIPTGLEVSFLRYDKGVNAQSR